MPKDERHAKKGEQGHMLDQALDFRVESDVFFALLDSLEEPDWSRPTQFKDWTINDVLAHIHLGNYLADLSLQDSRAFLDFIQTFGRANKKGASRLAATHEWLDGLCNRALLQRWREFYAAMSDRFADADPKAAGQMGRPGYERALKHQRPPDGNLGARPGRVRRIGPRAQRDRPPQKRRRDRHQYLWLDLSQPGPAGSQRAALCPAQRPVGRGVGSGTRPRTRTRSGDRRLSSVRS